MTSFKFSVRIAAMALAVTAFAASCAEILGDFEVIQEPDQVVQSNLPDAGVPAAEVICELGTTQCSGRLLQLCTDGGTAWVTLQACASEALCESSGLSTVSACIRPTCAAEEMSCDGSVLRVCNPDRAGWDVFDECESPAHCNAGNRRCEPAPCVAGERRCNVGNLERCQDDRLDWQALDTCATNELCLFTLERATAALLASAGVAPGNDTSGAGEAAGESGPLVLDVSACELPPCVDGEVRCEGARLDICNEGRTAFEQLEQCATDVLCGATLTYVGQGGRPRCRQPVCDIGEHQCTPEGILQVCTPGREGYTTIEACIGPPFCNASAADRGERGCTDAECAPGETQCNGAQIQRCLADRTGFEALGSPCETRGLCNDDNAADVRCDAAACQRGQFSGTEFRCQGATLQRCNDQHTGYEAIATCASQGLCNAGLGLQGCVTPACAPGETICTGDFLQVCNGQRTGFQNLERCAPGTCDGTLGRCADPCVVGSARCNAQGQVEECRDRLVGREVTASCLSPQLCDASSRGCQQAPAGCTADGVRRCRPQGANTVLEVCSDGRSRFAVLDTCGPGEFCDINNDRCDVCNQASQPTCEGNTLVTCSANGQNVTRTTCQNGCQVVASGPDRCRTCTPGAASCDGAQLAVCEERATGEVLDHDDCDSGALCQQTLIACNSGRNGEVCQCTPGACDENDVGCRGRERLRCSADFTGMEPVPGPAGVCTETLCNPETGNCDECLAGFTRCAANGSMEGCRTDGSGFDTIRPEGIARCVAPEGPAQTCDRNDDIVNDVPCPSGICIDRVGCVECREQGFTPTCTTTPAGLVARTQCQGGSIVPVACPDADDPCFTVSCSNQGGCSAQPKCDGSTPICTDDGRCVACVEREDCRSGEVCNANNQCVPEPCTANVCAGGNLRICQTDGSLSAPQTCPVTGECASPTACRPCAAADCQAPDACTAAQCSADGTRCLTASACTGGQVCDGTRCGTPVSCGDGRVSAPSEQCDGTNLDSATCATFNFDRGTLACGSDCRFDTSGCANDECGDGAVTGGEQCDGQNLDDQSCQTLNFDRGTLRCSTVTCTFDTSGCANDFCGDGLIATGEQCDGENLNGQTCVSQGFASGTLVCAECKLDTSGCVANVCGDGIPAPPEQCDTREVTSIECPNGATGVRACEDCRFVDRCPAPPINPGPGTPPGPPVITVP